MIFTSDKQVYTGITTDVRRRWHEHASGKGGARYFRGRQPVRLCYLESEHTRSSASQRETAIKAMSAPAKRALITQHSAGTQEEIARHRLETLGQGEALKASAC